MPSVAARVTRSLKSFATGFSHPSAQQWGAWAIVLLVVVVLVGMLCLARNNELFAIQEPFQSGAATEAKMCNPFMGPGYHAASNRTQPDVRATTCDYYGFYKPVAFGESLTVTGPSKVRFCQADASGANSASAASGTDPAAVYACNATNLEEVMEKAKTQMRKDLATATRSMSTQLQHTTATMETQVRQTSAAQATTVRGIEHQDTQLQQNVNSRMAQMSGQNTADQKLIHNLIAETKIATQRQSEVAEGTSRGDTSGGSGTGAKFAVLTHVPSSAPSTIAPTSAATNALATNAVATNAVATNALATSAATNQAVVTQVHSSAPSTIAPTSAATNQAVVTQVHSSAPSTIAPTSAATNQAVVTQVHSSAPSTIAPTSAATNTLPPSIETFVAPVQPTSSTPFTTDGPSSFTPSTPTNPDCNGFAFTAASAAACDQFHWNDKPAVTSAFMVRDPSAVRFSNATHPNAGSYIDSVVAEFAEDASRATRAFQTESDQAAAGLTQHVLAQDQRLQRMAAQAHTEQSRISKAIYSR